MAAAISEKLVEVQARMRATVNKRNWAAVAAGGGMLTTLTGLTLSSLPSANGELLNSALVGAVAVAVGGLADGLFREGTVSKLRHELHQIELVPPIERLQQIAAGLPGDTVGAIGSALDEIRQITVREHDGRPGNWSTAFKSIGTVFSRTAEVPESE